MIIVITGASRGIGKYLADYYNRCGETVITASRTPNGESAWAIDVGDAECVKGFARTVAMEHNHIDVLINCAGVASMNHALLTPDKTVKNVFATNVEGTFYLCQHFARLLRKAEHPRIINFSSVAAPLNLEGEAVYAASKAAVESLTRTLAKELAPWKITVNAVGPGPVATDLIKGVPKDKLVKVFSQQAIKRETSMLDIRNIVDFFVSPLSDMVTGQVIYTGGVS